MAECVGGATSPLPWRSQTMAAMERAALELLLTREMPFGKHKGCLVADLPGNYLQWFARDGFPPGEIGRLLALMHEIDHNGLQHLLAPLRSAGAQGGKRRRVGG